MEQLSEDPMDLLMAPGELSGLGIAGGDHATGAGGRVRLMHRRFPGRLDVHLEPAEATQLAGLLRTRQDGEAGPIRVGKSVFPATNRQVVTLVFRIDFPGQLFLNVSDADAARVADELDQMVARIQQPQAGVQA